MRIVSRLILILRLVSLWVNLLKNLAQTKLLAVSNSNWQVINIGGTSQREHFYLGKKRLFCFCQPFNSDRTWLITSFGKMWLNSFSRPSSPKNVAKFVLEASKKLIVGNFLLLFLVGDRTITTQSYFSSTYSFLGWQTSLSIRHVH